MTAGSALGAGAHRLLFGAGQLSTGAARGVQLNGLTISSSVDNAGSGSTGLIANSDGSVMAAVSMSLAAADAVAFKTNAAPVTFSFTSARVLPAGQHVTITLPASYFVDRPNPAVLVVTVNAVQGVVAPTATCTLVTVPACTITCMTAGSALDAGAHRLVFGAGQLSTGAARGVQLNGLTISSSVDRSASSSSPSIFIHSILFESQSDLFAHKQTSGSVNISFFCRIVLPAGGRITIHLPNGFFVANSQPLAQLALVAGAPAIMCAISAVSIICTTSNRNLEPGLSILRFVSGTLTTGISRSETNDSFKIETSVEASTVASFTPALATGRVRMQLPAIQNNYSHFNYLCSV
jgi:hypothetical protein